MTDMSNIQTEVMDVALNTYLGDESQWCTGSYANDQFGNPVLPGSLNAEKHCGEGALTAATSFVLGRRGIDWEDRHAPFRDLSTAVIDGVAEVLTEQHPDIVAVARQRQCSSIGVSAYGQDIPVSIPAFNDGLVDCVISDGVEREKRPGIKGVGYQGIRAAFEKYHAVCQEKGL